MQKRSRSSKKAPKSHILVIALSALALLVVLVGVSFAQSNDDSANQQRTQKDMENRLRDLQRDVIDIKRVAPTVDTSKVDGLFSQYSQCISKSSSLIGTPEFWGSSGECNYIMRDIDDVFQVYLRPQRQCGEVKRNIENRKKERKNNFDRQVKDILRNDKTIDLSIFTAITDQIDDALDNTDVLLSGECTQNAADTLNDINRDLDGYFQDGYGILNDLQQLSNSAQRLKQGSQDLKNYKQQCKDMVREFKNFDKDYARSKKVGVTEDFEEGYNAVKLLVDTMCDPEDGTVIKMELAIQAGDVDAFEDLRNDSNGVQQDYWTLLNDVRGVVNEKQRYTETLTNVTKDLQQQGKELQKMRKQVERIKKQFAKASKKQLASAEQKQAVGEFGDFIKRFDELIGAIEGGLAAAQEEAKNDPESYWTDRADQVNEYKQEFYELQQDVEMVANAMQGLNEASKGLNSIEKEVGRMKKNWSAETAEKVNDVLVKARGNFQEAWRLVVSDPEGARDLLQDIFDLKEDLDDILEERETEE